MQRTPTSRARQAGFTLIELLAVLMILAILIAILVTNLGGARGLVEAGVTKTNLRQIAAAIGELSDELGQYPPSQLAEEFGAPPNPTNVGAECLYLALCAQGAPGHGVLDKSDKLCNVDSDSLSKRPKGFETQELFELADGWGNPIAYIHAHDYDREFQYTCVDPEGEQDVFTVRAAKNPKTGRYEEPNGFQLVSAGLDGRFGTGDDLTNYAK